MQDIDRLILIDDDEITNFLHKALVDQMAIAKEVVTFNSAKRALAYLLDNRPQTNLHKCPNEVILVDINMPEMNGFEFLEELEANQYPRHLKIILASSSQNARDLNQAKKYPICEHISKPLTQEKMLAIMDKVRQDKTTGCLS